MTPKSTEISGGFDDARWNEIMVKITEKKVNIPVFAFIDWSSNLTSPLGVFSQKLNPEQQRDFLVKADDYFARRGIHFGYPIHGGTFPGKDAQRLAFGKYGTYDSQAPEFQTYETI